MQETSWNLKLQLSKRERETPLTLQGQQSHWFCYPPDSSGSGWTGVCRIDASYDIMIEYSYQSGYQLSNIIHVISYIYIIYTYTHNYIYT